MIFDLISVFFINEIVLLDVNQNLAEGEALDITPGIGIISGANVRTGSYTDCTDSDIIVITAGKSRVPGQTRADLLEDNKAIMNNILMKLFQCGETGHCSPCYRYTWNGSEGFVGKGRDLRSICRRVQ